MKTQIAFSIMVSIVALFPAGCSTALTSATHTQPSIEAFQIISPDDPRFFYEGRFDFSDPNATVVIWQASRISIDFEGDSISLLFDNTKGQNFFNANLNGSTTIIEISEGSSPQGAKLANLGIGRHSLVLFKRSEGGAGTTRFRGARIPIGSRIWAPAKPEYKLAMEFFGDSLTAGACNEDGDTDQWETLRTHNSALSYAAMTAEAFSADHRNIAVSGMGVSTGWTKIKGGEMWDRLYPKVSSPPADLNTWTPDVVFVFLGANDDSFTRSKNQLFPADFTEKYVSLVREIRVAYPNPHIVLLMSNKYGPSLRQAWEAAVKQLESSDKAISHYVFKHWVKHHPRVVDDRAMADELINWLKQQDFMKPYQ